MTITNNTSSAQPVKLYHAADCYLQGSDTGFGFLDAANGTRRLYADPERLAGTN